MRPRTVLPSFSVLVIAAVIVVHMPSAGAALLRVGPQGDYALPSEAARAARDGDTVEIQAGTYVGDVAVWRQNNLTLRGVGGKAKLIAEGRAAEDKAIWVIKGRYTLVQNIEFHGARVSDGNGAGIRHEGVGLTISHCRFVDNENGLLSGRNPDDEIIIEHSEFAGNGAGDGSTHNIYIGGIRTFTIKHSYIHHARVGHQIKTRARENYVLYNRIMDEADGDSSYLIDIAEGGLAYVVGNVMQQGEQTENSTAISYGAEGSKSWIEELYVVNNTIVNDLDRGRFVANRHSQGTARLVNNALVGAGEILKGPGEIFANLKLKKSKFVDPTRFDYRPKLRSPAIDAGVEPGSAHNFLLQPLFEYQHAMGTKPRAIDARVDVGAFEYEN